MLGAQKPERALVSSICDCYTIFYTLQLATGDQTWHCSRRSTLSTSVISCFTNSRPSERLQCRAELHLPTAAHRIAIAIAAEWKWPSLSELW